MIKSDKVSTDNQFHVLNLEDKYYQTQLVMAFEGASEMIDYLNNGTLSIEDVTENTSSAILCAIDLIEVLFETEGLEQFKVSIKAKDDRIVKSILQQMMEVVKIELGYN